uniref:Uncharacterized protein n=1 Tax=Anguilla anguilla TaxID=7936 RepID=A0A0E9RBE1_ANGAN
MLRDTVNAGGLNQPFTSILLTFVNLFRLLKFLTGHR